MTEDTRYRRYPIPTSARETGNGGAHSEALARAVAADMDALDAAWAAEAVHATASLTLSADANVGGSNSETSISLNQVEHQSGVGIIPSPGSGTFGVPKGVSGWYHIAANIRAGATGAITANARHLLMLKVWSSPYGYFINREIRYTETFQSGSLDVYNALEGMFFLDSTFTVGLYYLHTNVGSTVAVRAASSRFTATRIVGA